MKLHVLPGDSLAGEFKKANIEGDAIICRECLIVGDVTGETLDEFWGRRANFLMLEYGGDEIEYQETVVGELVQLTGLSTGTEVNLWFEYELFCQSNMWFCLSLLAGTGANVYRVEPTVRAGDEIWKGFGSLETAELKECFESRQIFSEADLNLGIDLWNAYRSGDHERLRELGRSQSICFPYLSEVCEAEMLKSTLPLQILDEIIAGGIKDFDKIFLEFTRRAGVYGFGDAQVARILDRP